jgi:hypothetical protein
VYIYYFHISLFCQPDSSICTASSISQLRWGQRALLSHRWANISPLKGKYTEFSGVFAREVGKMH